MADDGVTLQLSDDEALVLFEWLSRMDNEDALTSLANRSEQRVLWDVVAMLEPQIDDLFRPDYAELVQAATDRLAPRDSEQARG